MTIKLENAQNEEDKRRAAEKLGSTEKRLEIFKKDIPDTDPGFDPNQPTEDQGELPPDHHNPVRSRNKILK